MKAGDYITFTVDGFIFATGGAVNSGGIHVGQFERQSVTDATQLIKSADPEVYNQVQDGHSSTFEDAEYRIIFNERIETLTNINLSISYRGSQRYAASSREHQETMSIKDAKGDVLSSKSFLIQPISKQDKTAPYDDKSMTEFKIASPLTYNMTTASMSSALRCN